MASNFAAVAVGQTPVKTFADRDKGPIDGTA